MAKTISMKTIPPEIFRHFRELRGMSVDELALVLHARMVEQDSSAKRAEVASLLRTIEGSSGKSHAWSLLGRDRDAMEFVGKLLALLLQTLAVTEAELLSFAAQTGGARPS